jgi:hypothetical protein
MADGGVDCPQDTDQLRRQVCGTNCELNDWTPCLNGIRTKSIKKEMAGGGIDCPQDTDQLRRQNCNDCSGNWIWTPCEATCDGIQTSKIGSRTSIYKIITPASNGGVNCNILDGKIETDNNCIKTCPIDCSGNWNYWSDCSANSKSRTFQILNGNTNCNIPAPQSIYCYNDCIFSDWSKWSECDCNTKIITRKKTVINNNNLNCNDIIENQNCSNNEQCLKLECESQYKFYNLEIKQCQNIFDYILFNLINLFK